MIDHTKPEYFYHCGKLSEDSDLDFIVQFDRDGYERAFDQFLDFKHRLEEIYERPVDLIPPKNVQKRSFSKRGRAI